MIGYQGRHNRLALVFEPQSCPVIRVQAYSAVLRLHGDGFFKGFQEIIVLVFAVIRESETDPRDVENLAIMER
jgi:hypothetical protein